MAADCLIAENAELKWALTDVVISAVGLSRSFLSTFWLQVGCQGVGAAPSRTLRCAEPDAAMSRGGVVAAAAALLDLTLRFAAAAGCGLTPLPLGATGPKTISRRTMPLPACVKIEVYHRCKKVSHLGVNGCMCQPEI